jgi:hypothetical protein
MKFITMHGHLYIKVTVQVFSGDHLRGYTLARYFARCLALCCWELYDKWQRFANIYVHAHGSMGKLDHQGTTLIFSEVTPRSLRILPSVRRAESVQNNTKGPNVLYVWCLPHHGLCLGLFCTTACRPSQLCLKQQIFFCMLMKCPFLLSLDFFEHTLCGNNEIKRSCISLYSFWILSYGTLSRYHIVINWCIKHLSKNKTAMAIIIFALWN